MARQHFLLLALVASIHHSAFAAASTSANITADATGTAYDILEKNNLPRGLLPQGVRSYVLNPDGKLEVTLPGECNFFVTQLGGQKYKLQIASTFGGVVHAGSITEIYGVDVQVKYAWLGFSQVDRAGDQLTFHVQKFTQSFPVSGFAVSPSCT